MSTQVAKLLEDALKLPNDERADLASCLFASLEAETHAQIDADWEAEIARRIHAIDTKLAKLISWEAARQRIFGNA